VIVTLTKGNCDMDKVYQAHLKLRAGRTFALPVVGTRKTIWDKIASHMHYRTMRNWSETTAKPVRAIKARFELVEVKS